MADVAVIRDFFVALGFKTNESDAKKMQGSLVDTEAKAKLLNKALVGLAAAALVAVAKTAQELDKLYYSSQRIGASASNVQAFGDAISQLGGNAEAAVASLESVSQKIRNSPGYEKMVQGLGVATRDQNGAVRDRVEVLKDLSGTLAKMPHYQANAYASSLGIDEQTMMSMRDGKFISGIEKYQKMRKEMGMTDELAKSGTDFMVESRELGMAVKGVSEVLLMTAGKALIPFLKLINKGIQTAIHLFSELHPAIKGTLAAGLKFAFLALVLKGFLNSLMMLRTGLTLLMSFLPVLKALRLAFLMSPIGIILALAAAFALLWEDYKTWKEGGKSGFNWSGWAEGFDKIINKIKDFIEMINKIKDKVINFIKKVVDDPVGAVQEVTEAAQEALTSVAQSEPVQNAIQFGKKLGDAVSDEIASIANSDTGKVFVGLGAMVAAKSKEVVESIIDPLPDYPAYSKQPTPKTSDGLAAFAQNQSVPGQTAAKLTSVVNQSLAYSAAVAKIASEGARGVVGASKDSFSHFIGKGEGGYNSVNLGKKYGYKSDTRDLVKMTVAQVWALQSSREVNAVGKFQIIRDTMPAVIAGMGLKGGEKFDEDMQERMGAWLLFNKRERLGGYLKGDHNNLRSAGDSGAREWASLPVLSDELATTSGKKTYRAKRGSTAYSDGVNKALHSVSKYEEVLRNAREVYQNAIKSGMSESDAEVAAFRGSTVNISSHNVTKTNMGKTIYAPPTGNPEKSQINSSSSMSASNITIHQSFQTDMTLNGVSSPAESANAIKRQQENQLVFMARGARNVVVG